MAQTIDVSGLPVAVINGIEQLVATLRGNMAATNGSEPISDSLTLEEYERELDHLSDGLPELPTLPPDFSREDIYCDHD